MVRLYCGFFKDLGLGLYYTSTLITSRLLVRWFSSRLYKRRGFTVRLYDLTCFPVGYKGGFPVGYRDDKSTSWLYIRVGLPVDYKRSVFTVRL